MVDEIRNRKTLIKWLESMLPPVSDYKQGNGAAYGGNIRQFEYFSRPLWAVFSLLASGDLSDEQVEPYIKRIKAGVNPESDQYFGEPTTETRQMVVEMAVYGFGLAYCKDKLLNYFTTKERQQLVTWLNLANNCVLPEGNWYLFWVLINSGLKFNGETYSQENLDIGLAKAEEFYLGEGWYNDGNGVQRDYYVSFAFHFYLLLYANLIEDRETKEKYVKRSSVFAKDFIYWFDAQGRSLPFGRSLTYRFAHVSFWSALLVADVDVFSPRIIKGLIFRNLRWWQSQPIIDETGVLSVGYGYSNLIMSEDYNAPGSPMWAFKAFTLLLLPEEHSFWQVEEEPLPEMSCTSVQADAGFLFKKDEMTGDQYALSSKQYSLNEGLLHNSEKYSKFCYSNHFGFNLTRDQTMIENCACDSTLALSIKGTNQFFTRNKVKDSVQSSLYSRSTWNYGDVADMNTWLIPIDGQRHIRVHHLVTHYDLVTYEGSFPLVNWNRKFDEFYVEENYGYVSNDNGVVGILNMGQTGELVAVPQNPNSNIYNNEKSVVPTIKRELTVGEHVLITGIYGSQIELGKITSAEVTTTLEKIVNEVDEDLKKIILRYLSE